MPFVSRARVAKLVDAGDLKLPVLTFQDIPINFQLR
jgi:hypothetical protein